MPALATVTDEEVVNAGKAIAAEGRSVNGFSLRRTIGRGDPTRLGTVWEANRQTEAPVSEGVLVQVVVPPAVADRTTEACEELVSVMTGLGSSLWVIAERIAIERARGEAEAARAEATELRSVVDEALKAVVEADAAADQARERAEAAEATAAERVAASDRSVVTARAEAAAEVERAHASLQAALDAVARIGQA